MKKILFLCTGNSCRSQMGEALYNHHRGFDDPPALTKNLQNKEEILTVFHRVRDGIKEMVLSL